MVFKESWVEWPKCCGTQLVITVYMKSTVVQTSPKTMLMIMGACTIYRITCSDKSLGDKPGNEANTISRDPDPTIGIITCHQSTQWLRS